MKAALEQNGFKGCKDADLEPVFTYLEFCLKQVRDTLLPQEILRSKGPWAPVVNVLTRVLNQRISFKRKMHLRYRGDLMV